MDTLIRILMTILLCVPYPAYSGAWLQPTAQGYGSLNASYYRSDRYWDGRGHSRKQPTFNKLELNPYVEYGLTDETTLGANLFVQQLSQGSHDNWALSDSEIFSRHTLFSKNTLMLSVEPLLKLPSFHVRDTLPKGGSDSFDAQLAALAGYGFEWLGKHHYADANMAYRHRFDGALGDQLKTRIALGLSIIDSLQIIPALSYTHSLESPHAMAFSESGQTNYDLLKAECAVAYTLATQQVIQLGVFSHLQGRNAGAGDGFTLGVAQEF